MREAKRIAKLALIHGEPYLDQLLTIAEHAGDDEVRRFAYEEFYKHSR
jgi:hypothetical protein